MRCGLTTPLFMQVLPTKRPNSCGIRARYCDALCAAMMTQFLLQLCAHFGSVFRQLREIVRARVAQGGAAIRAGCAHSSGSVGTSSGLTVARLSVLDEAGARGRQLECLCNAQDIMAYPRH